MARQSIISLPSEFVATVFLWLPLAMFLWTGTCVPALGMSDSWVNCRSSGSIDARIAGCSEIIARGMRAAKRDQFTAYVNRGAAYREKGDFTRAIADLDKALLLNPKSTIALLERASANYARGALDAALADFGKALDLDKNLAAAYRGRARVYLDKGDSDRAIADLDEAINHDRGRADAYDERGQAFLAKGDPGKALADFSEAIALDPGFARAFLDRAKAYRSERNLDRAKQDLEAALKLDPKLTAAQEALDEVNGLIAKSAEATRPAAPATKPPVERTERPMPLASAVLFRIGPVNITRPVVTTWAIMLALTVSAWLMTRRLRERRDRSATIVEVLVTNVMEQIREVIGVDARPYLPLLGTLFIFLVAANLSSVLPGVEAPTSKLETPAALALIVFASVHYFGVRAQGVVGYLASFAKPRLIMLPLNILSQLTRTFSLMIRLFGNVMSGEFVIALVVALSGLFVPIPLMALEVLVGIVQAYIFTVLATVFIGAAIGSVETA